MSTVDDRVMESQLSFSAERAVVDAALATFAKTYLCSIDGPVARAATEAARALGLDDAHIGAIVRELMRASGAGGMIGGQLLDLEGEGAPLSLRGLERVHRMKTGALISASVRIGGLAALANDETLRAFERYGSAVGLAFQIADDVLDVTSTTDELGKTAGRDAALRKSTYPAVLGLGGARARAERLCDEACLALREAGIHSAELESLAHFVVDGLP